MDKRLAQEIVQNFDMKTIQVLEAYIEDRKAFLHKQMETSEPDNFRKLQGACIELELLRKLRDHAVAIKDKET